MRVKEKEIRKCHSANSQCSSLFPSVIKKGLSTAETLDFATELTGRVQRKMEKTEAAGYDFINYYITHIPTISSEEPNLTYHPEIASAFQLPTVTDLPIHTTGQIQL